MSKSQPQPTQASGIKDQIQDAMDEARTLVLGTQVLLGFQYQSVFEPRFPQLTDFEQAFSLLSLGLLLVAFCLLILPAANHIIANHGEDDGEEYRLTTDCVGLALAPFALALGFAVYLAAVHVVGQLGSILCGVVMAGLAASFWYGLAFRGRRHHSWKETTMTETRDTPKTPIRDRIRHLMTETRVIIPGAQALLGFAGVTTLMDSFDSLPQTAKTVHLVGLLAVTLSVVLLMTPAAYHRLTGHSEGTEEFYQVASRLVIAAMFPLAVSLAAELFVVVFKVAGSAGPQP
jgi:hypothetical protein